MADAQQYSAGFRELRAGLAADLEAAELRIEIDLAEAASLLKDSTPYEGDFGAKHTRVTGEINGTRRKLTFNPIPEEDIPANRLRGRLRDLVGDVETADRAAVNSCIAQLIAKSSPAAAKEELSKWLRTKHSRGCVESIAAKAGWLVVNAFNDNGLAQLDSLWLDLKTRSLPTKPENAGDLWISTVVPKLRSKFPTALEDNSDDGGSYGRVNVNALEILADSIVKPDRNQKPENTRNCAPTQLSKRASAILTHLDKSRLKLTPESIARTHGFPKDIGTVRKYVNELLQCGFVERKSRKSGINITESGRTFVHSDG